MMNALSPLMSHLLQSTAFGLLAGLLTLAFRANSASTRFWIWFAASVKFLIPFYWLISLGGRLGWHIAPHSSPMMLWLPELVSGKKSLIPASSQMHPQATDGIVPAMMFAIWIIGVVVCVARWRSDWSKANRLAHSAAQLTAGSEFEALERLRQTLGLKTSVRLFSSDATFEPCIFGIARPLLILPASIRTQLTLAELETILVHELSHVRRRDNLLAAIHMFVQSLFWFHPLVWWLRVQLLEERERACDEAVLQSCSEPAVYARTILHVCRLCLESQGISLAGIGSANVRQRLERIVRGEIGRPLTGLRKMLLATSALAVLALPVAVGLVFAPPGDAQQSPVISALPSFEVASIKPSNPDSHLSIQFAAGGRLLVTHATLRFLIKIAYDLTDDQIVGGPAWLSTARFDVEGKPSSSLGGDPQTMTKGELGIFHEKVRLRLQRLLAERFQLEFRTESKSMPVFALVVNKNGTKLKSSSVTGDPEMNFGHGVLQAKRIDMPTFARFLAEGQTGRPVSDETGLTDKFDFRLEWTPDSTLNPDQPPPDAGGTSIFTALQQQLGLKLEPRITPANCAMITRALLPAAN